MKVKSGLKKIGLGLLGLLFVLAIVYRDLVGYGLMQLRGQLQVVREAVSLEAFLASDSTTQEQKQKVQIILEAKAFAFEELGINFSENYATIFDQKGKPSMYVVTACDPFSFRPRMWSFPVVGQFPYKGYFERDKAVDEFRRVRDEEGLDASIRTAGGWSTLGWFKDPVLSNMLNRSEGDLASLIIHELTHGTLFVKDSVTFNENLATFIGDKGAVLFMEKKYGKEAPEVIDFLNKMEDELRFKDYMLKSAQHLNELYESFENEPDSIRMSLKTERISAIRQHYDTIDFKSDAYKGYFEDFTPNNTFFMSMLRYNAQQDELEKVLRNDFDGDLKEYLVFLKQKYPSL